MQSAWCTAGATQVQQCLPQGRPQPVFSPAVEVCEGDREGSRRPSAESWLPGGLQQHTREGVEPRIVNMQKCLSKNVL